MRPHHARTLLTILGLTLLLGAALLDDMYGPTGRAISAFSATVTVTGITYNITNATQAAQPVTGGANVTIAIPVLYTGTGIANLTVAKPVGYESAVTWSLIEDGTLKNVLVVGDNLQWTADLDATSVTLNLTALPPVVTVVDTTVLGTAYNRTIRISADVHYTGVRASVALDPTARNVTLLENGTLTDRTTDYNLTITNGVATWEGFNLSGQTFLLTAIVTPAVAGTSDGSSSGSGQSSGDGFWEVTLLEPTALSPVVRFTLEPLDVVVDLASPGASDTVDFTVTNRLPEPTIVRLHATASFVTLSDTVLTLAPNEARTITATLNAIRTGVQETRIIADDGMIQQHAFVAIRVPEPPIDPSLIGREPVSFVIESPTGAWRSWWTDAMLLLGTTMLGAIAAFWHRKSRRAC